MSEIAPARPVIIQVVSYYPPHLGGMENCAQQIAERCADQGYRVLVYTSDRGDARSVVSRAKAQVHYLKSFEFAHTPVMFTLLFRLLALPRHALIHLHIAQAFAPEVVYLASRLRGIPYIAHIHLDVDPSGPLGFLLGPYKKFFLKRVLQSAAKIICLSEPQKALIAAKYRLPLASFMVIPNGVAERYFVGERTGYNPVPHLLFVGRLAAQKNLPLLIEALSHLKEKVYLDIVGEGEDRTKIEATILKYRLQNVRMHGRKCEDALIELYTSADVFVLPSLKEGVSLAMLEALAAGLPVVASDSPEMRQMLRGCGVLIQNPTAENYAKALDELLANKEVMRKLGALSVQTAHLYSWEHVVKCVEDVYQQVMCSPRRDL